MSKSGPGSHVGVDGRSHWRDADAVPVADEQAFCTRRDALGEQFARWLNTHKVAGDPNDAGLLMDWKFGYADGALDGRFSQSKHSTRRVR